MATDLATPNGTEVWSQGEAGMNGGLDDISAFNTSICTPDATNDPDLAFLNTRATPYHFDSPLPATCEASTFDPTPSSVCPQSDPYYPSAEPHFSHPSTMQTFYPYSPRRSVSEPPADHMSYDYQMLTRQPAITFHRGGHYLGDAQPATRLKSLPRHKHRPHPYGRTKARPSQPRPQPPRHHLHRSQTMPVPAGGPTSAPRMYDPGMGGGDVSCSSTRVCTPEPVFDAVVDPGVWMGERVQDQIMLEMSREELKSLIAEAVQKVMEEREGKGVLEREVEASVEV